MAVLTPPSVPFAVAVVVFAAAALAPRHASALTRHDFPEGFVFGAGSSANQVEGAVAEDGRTPSIWDTFTHQDPCRCRSSFHLLTPGLGGARPATLGDRRRPSTFSTAPPHRRKIQPQRTPSAIRRLPLRLQILQDEYGGLLSPRFIEDYTAYAEVCFENFGDRVKHWVTVNEPNIETIGGYDNGCQPPRHCSYPFGADCMGGNSSTEPYIAAHHLLLAHASAVSLYREKYTAAQGGEIGITLLGFWYEPATNTPQDAAGAAKMNDFHIGWFMHPLVYGDYPPVMRIRVGARLPALTAPESEKVRGSFDFVGFNHYLIVRVRSIDIGSNHKPMDYYIDADPVEDIFKGKIETAPWSLRKLLEHLKLNYGNLPVWIHENGYADAPGTLSKAYLEALYLSIRNGSDARGYFVWSFLDVFEYLFGYTMRFGLCGVDMSSQERTRYIRNSARWYSGFLAGGELRPVGQCHKSRVN